MERARLGNGITVLFQPIDGLDILSCNVFLPLGSSSDKVPGITSLSLRTGIKRSRKRNELSFYTRLERWGTPFVSDTSTDYSVVRFQTLPEGAREVLELLLETLELPDFGGESFSVEKEAQLAAIRSRKESAFSLALREILRRTYGNTPYAYLPNGEEETVLRITLEDAKAWFGNNVLPRGTVFSFAGKGNFERLIGLLEKAETKEIERVAFQTPKIKEGYSEVRRKGSSQTLITITFEAPPLTDERYSLFRVVNTFLGEGIGSVMFQELREKRGYAYSAGSVYSARQKGGRLILYIGTSPEKEMRVIDDLKALKEKLPDFATREAINRAKRYLIGNYTMEHETRDKRSWYSGFWELAGKGYRYDSGFIDEVEKVGLKEVKSALEEISGSPHYTVVVKG